MQGNNYKWNPVQADREFTEYFPTNEKEPTCRVTVISWCAVVDTFRDPSPEVLQTAIAIETWSSLVILIARTNGIGNSTHLPLWYRYDNSAITLSEEEEN